MRALLSVYDKEGLVEFAQGLADLGWELVASGNTSAKLREAGIAHSEVAEVTGSPEMLGGRVKTLHPKIHGGILADRSKPEHLEDLKANGIEAIDLVVSNLYPFSSDPSVELIDIGGPTMVRAAAKNHEHVGIVTSPADYPVRARGAARVGLAVGGDAPAAGPGRVRAHGRLRRGDRRLAGPGRTEAGGRAGGGERRRRRGGRAVGRAAADAAPHARADRGPALRREPAPAWFALPHRRARPAGGTSMEQHGGSALSYLNIFDGDAAWRLVHELAADAGAREVAVAIIKHANPCGAAVGGDLVTAYERALECDPLSAFGGVVAIGGDVDAARWPTRSRPGRRPTSSSPSSYTPEAVEKLRGAAQGDPACCPVRRPSRRVRQLRSLGASVLVQDVDAFVSPRTSWQTVTKRAPTEEEWRDLVLAWRVCGRTTSNAIAVVTNGQAVGVGAGQQSRVVAAEIAVQKAGERAKGGAGASDAFFPFPDGLLVLADAGVTAVVQPGGSVKDGEVVAAADEAGLAMVLTGERHFKH